MASLLPIHSSSELERNLSEVLSQATNLDVQITDLWKFGETKFLSHQTENLLIGFITDLLDNPKDKIEITQNVIAIYHQLGTVECIKFVAKKLGFGEIEVVENPRGRKDAWFEYSVLINNFASFDKVRKLKKILPQLTPVRCELFKVIVTEPLRYNGEGQYNGNYTFGAY